MAKESIVAALRDIIAANNDFRAGMPKDWEGDPLQDAIQEAEKLLFTENGGVGKEDSCPHCGSAIHNHHWGWCGV